MTQTSRQIVGLPSKMEILSARSKVQSLDANPLSLGTEHQLNRVCGAAMLEKFPCQTKFSMFEVVDEIDAVLPLPGHMGLDLRTKQISAGQVHFT